MVNDMKTWEGMKYNVLLVFEKLILGLSLECGELLLSLTTSLAYTPFFAELPLSCPEFFPTTHLD